MSITDVHVMTADTVMCDESYLYIVMPFCRGGDLCQRVAEVDKFSEDESRFWFRQILKVSCFIFCCTLRLPSQVEGAHGSLISGT